jgi:hypothetical protein
MRMVRCTDLSSGYLGMGWVGGGAVGGRGAGVMKWPDGALYDGDWKNSKIHGQGAGGAEFRGWIGGRPSPETGQAA